MIKSLFDFAVIALILAAVLWIIIECLNEGE
jgi:hypothetical protein